MEQQKDEFDLYGNNITRGIFFDLEILGLKKKKDSLKN